MRIENHKPEEHKNGGRRPIPIMWEGSETFTLHLIRREVGARLLYWNGSEAKWIAPFLCGDDKSASSIGFLNFTADI